MQTPLLSPFRRAGILRTHAALLLLLAPTAGAQTPITRLQRGTIEYDGANYDIQSAVLSADGKYVALEATATNITNPDQNGKRDVFLVESATGYVRLVSHFPGVPGSESAKPGNGDSMHPAISADGRWVAFASDASDLLGKDLMGQDLDQNGVRDVFLFDRLAAQGAAVIRLSEPTPGVDANGTSDHPSVDDSGNLIAFQSAADNLPPGQSLSGSPQIFLLDRSVWSITRISNTTLGGVPNGPSTRPAISGNGQFIAFQSQAANLVSNDGNGAVQDVFITNVFLGRTVIASRQPGPGQQHLGNPSGAPSISSSGEHVAFESAAPNLGGGMETNLDWDVFVSNWDGSTAIGVQGLTRISRGPLGAEAAGDSRNPVISRGASPSDGQFVVFESTADNLDGAPGLNAQVEIFGVDRTSLLATLMSGSAVGVATTDCTRPSVGSDLSRVSFISIDDNIALPAESTTDDPDVFLNWAPDINPQKYCLSQTSSIGCTPVLHFTGTPSETSSSPFTVSVTGMRGNVQGQFFYSLVGPNNVSQMNNGYLCVNSPIKRLPVFNTGGQSLTCQGSASIDMNAVIQDPNEIGLVPGAQVWMQARYRDPIDASDSLTEALYFVVMP